MYMMMDALPTPVEMLEMAHDIAVKEGMRFVYKGLWEIIVIIIPPFLFLTAIELKCSILKFILPIRYYICLHSDYSH